MTAPERRDDVGTYEETARDLWDLAVDTISLSLFVVVLAIWARADDKTQVLVARQEVQATTDAGTHLDDAFLPPDIQSVSAAGCYVDHTKPTYFVVYCEAIYKDGREKWRIAYQMIDKTEDYWKADEKAHALESHWEHIASEALKRAHQRR